MMIPQMHSKQELCRAHTPRAASDSALIMITATVCIICLLMTFTYIYLAVVRMSRKHMACDGCGR